MTRDDMLDTFTVDTPTLTLVLATALLIYYLLTAPVAVLANAATLVAIVVLIYGMGWLVEVLI